MMKALKLIHIILTIIFPRKLPKMEKNSKYTPLLYATDGQIT